MVMREAKGQEDAEFAKFEAIGDKLEGVYKDVRESDKYGKIYEFEVSGKKVILLGKTDIIPKMAEIPIGSFVSIKYINNIKTAKKNMLKEFEVLFDDGVIEEEEVKD